jgi:hypothetical protein
MKRPAQTSASRHIEVLIDEAAAAFRSAASASSKPWCFEALG